MIESETPPDVAPKLLVRAAGALAAPVAVVLFALVALNYLDLLAALVAFVVCALAIAVMVYRHFVGVGRLTSHVRTLARNEPDPAGAPHPGRIPMTAENLAHAVAALDHRWRERDHELRALVSANEALFESVPDPLLLVDDRHSVNRANAAARAMLGESTQGRRLDNLLRHPDVIEAAEDVLAGRKASETVEFAWPGVPERHFSARFAPSMRLPHRDEPRRPALLLVLHDVTALKQAEQMRADFVANVSHELRTPLTALLGFTETLRGAARDDAVARERFLGIMHEQALRMTRLVRDLLSLSKIEENEHSLPTGEVELARVIGSVVDALALQAKAKNIAIVIEGTEALPPLSGDADQLTQVFQNLIDNAIKYAKAKVRIIARTDVTPPGRVLASQRGADPKGWISIAVADDGEGIPREHLPRLTERFYRVDAARSRQLGGTGLGLAIVKHILNRHRGALTVDSETARGSIFTVWLPAA
jgi:two-component system, OmpR family, phosphate regulon sensor histidine kinase PhoR